MTQSANVSGANGEISACAAVADGDKMYQPVKASCLPGGHGKAVLATLRRETATLEADLAKALLES